MANSYSALGRWFEYLNDDCGYEQWSQYLIKTLKSLNAGAVGIDVGCGNGYFTRALNKCGYKVCGVDISPEALNVAKQISLKQGVNAEFLLGDIVKLKLNSKADFAVAVNDCLNYVPQNKLKAAFGRIYACLKKGGVFVFDISSEFKLKNIIGNNLFSEDKEKVTYIWFNKLYADRVEMDITLFEKEGDLYRRLDESQTQYIHTEEDVVSKLEEAGFSVRTEGHLGGDKLQRINFICRRQ